MKKLYPLLYVLFLIYWGCEDKTDDNTSEVVDDNPTMISELPLHHIGIG